MTNVTKLVSSNRHPCFVPCCPAGGQSPDYCLQSDRSRSRDCCLPKRTPETCQVRNGSVPVTTPPPQPICVPPLLPICTPLPPPCMPVCNSAVEEQPCVPCNPPQMMVCYKIQTTNGNTCTRSKSRELRASVLHVGCECEKHNGLQDNCPRSECHGNPECLTKPEPTCGPSTFAGMKHLGKPYCTDKKTESNQYQCYPAFVRIPPCTPTNGSNRQKCNGNGGAQSNFCPPCMPLIAQVPCPPSITVETPDTPPAYCTAPYPMVCLPPAMCCPQTTQMQSACYSPPNCLCPC
ncbi:keratin-associated protein 10-7-like isoform X2 [Cylas formicarius]|uniref:keratin-associated protein 10-7-like isoform X2 n=1 Tax=Cylas formicarius TaxID=197179 RepID=UPI0029584942|nr:keratin-associated protein 10-7-like isoform X2 [Cylas formicarius]